MTAREVTKTLTAVAALAAVLGATSCGPGGKFGKPISSAKEVEIGDILNEPGTFNGKTVVVKGQIATVDKDGFGFNLDNCRGTLLYVTTGGQFKISGAARYHLAIAEGVITVDAKTGTPTLKATGVEVK